MGLRAIGFRTSVGANLTKEEKVRIGRPSSPRWELDVVGYRGRDNVLQVIECKSYLDFAGCHSRCSGTTQGVRPTAVSSCS